MDPVSIVKFVSLVLYPLGLVCSCLALGVFLRLWGRRLAAARIWVFGCLLFWVFVTPKFAVGLTAYLESQFPPIEIGLVKQHDAIVVLGGGLRLPTEPANRVQFTGATDRYWLASKLYQQGKAPLIIVLGGNVFEQPGVLAESEYARDLLVEWGVPFDNIIVDTRSRTTEQNAIELRALLKQHPSFSQELLSLALVTSAMHMPRGHYLVQHHLQGVADVTAVSADVLVRSERLPWFKSWMPDAGALELLTRSVHEVYGIWFVKLKHTLQ